MAQCHQPIQNLRHFCRHGIKKRKWPVNGYFGLGFLLFTDQAGDTELSTTQANLSLAYHLLINKHNFLTGGFTGGIAQKSINQGNFQWGSQYDGTGFDPDAPSGEPALLDNTSFWDLGAGIMWKYFKDASRMALNDNLKADFGLAVHHVNTPNISFYETTKDILPMKFVVHSSASVGLHRTNIAIQPDLVFMQQGPTRELMFGSMFRYMLKEGTKYTGFVKEVALSLGTHYRWNDALIISSYFELSKFSIGFSYDVNVSDLRLATNNMGGFEISISYSNPSPFKYRRRTKYHPSF